jgi:hypothetical protein
MNSGLEGMKLKTVITICISLIFILELSSEVKEKTYQHFNLKSGLVEEFKTPGLTGKSYKPVVAIIPKTIIATLNETSGQMRAFVIDKSIVFQSENGDKLASFRILTKKQRDVIFQKLLISDKNSSLLIQTSKVGSYFIGITGSDANIPLNDLLYTRDNANSLSAAFTATVSAQAKKIKTQKNISLILPELAANVPKLYKNLLRSIQRFAQLATVLPLDKKELALADKYYEMTINIINQMKAKYPEKNNDFELIKLEFLVLAEGLLGISLDNDVVVARAKGLKRSASDNYALISKLTSFVNRLTNFIITHDSFEIENSSEIDSGMGDNYTETAGEIDCPEGQIARLNEKDNRWECVPISKPEEIKCPEGQIARLNEKDNRWECVPISKPEEIKCPEGQIARLNEKDNRWECVPISKPEEIKCPEGQIARLNEKDNRWECVPISKPEEIDCPEGQIARLNEKDNRWECVPISKPEEIDCPEGQIARLNEKDNRWECVPISKPEEIDCPEGQIARLNEKDNRWECVPISKPEEIKCPEGQIARLNEKDNRWECVPISKPEEIKCPEGQIARLNEKDNRWECVPISKPEEIKCPEGQIARLNEKDNRWICIAKFTINGFVFQN